MPNAANKRKPGTVQDKCLTNPCMTHPQRLTDPYQTEQIHQEPCKTGRNRVSRFRQTGLAKRISPRRSILAPALLALVILTATGCTVLPSEVASFPEDTQTLPSPVSADLGPGLAQDGLGSDTGAGPDSGSDASSGTATGSGQNSEAGDTDADNSASQNEAGARAALEEALAAMQTEEADRYWFTGYIRNTLEKHQVTSMFDGVVLRPKDAYLINARIAGQPYQYYRYEGQNYIKNRDAWYPVTGDVPLPFDPLKGFEDWLPLMDEAKALPDSTVLGIPVEVYEVRISGKEWVKTSPSELFSELAARVDSDEELERLLDQTIVKMTLKTGKEDRLIHEYETWIVMPLPGGGFVDQETFVRLYRFGDPSIETEQLPLPGEIQNWVNSYEEVEAEEK